VSSDLAPAEGPVDLVDRITAAVEGVRGVAGLHGGVLGEVATYLPGRRVTGIRLRGDDCALHVVAEWGTDLRTLVEDVRDAARPLVGGRVDVVVEDVASPGGDAP